MLVKVVGDWTGDELKLRALSVEDLDKAAAAAGEGLKIRLVDPAPIPALASQLKQPGKGLVTLVVDTPGQEVEIAFRHLAVGEEVVFDQVLAVSKGGKLTLGKPVVKGAKVKAAVLGSVQGEKIYVQKFARRKNYRRRTGHRSISTKVRIGAIVLHGRWRALPCACSRSCFCFRCSAPARG